MKARLHILLSGRVQGVFFRAFVRAWADRLCIKGYVANTPGGKVEAVFEGDKAALANMLRLCRRGPLLARVTSIKVKKERWKDDFQSFTIMR